MKETITLSGVPETMLQTIYARAKETKTRGAIHDEKAVELARARCNMAEMQLSEKRRELEDYRNETIKVIRGESRLNVDLLNELINKAQAARSGGANERTNVCIEA